jgi:1-deoxyxylulose-5-phosphate synthase
VKDVIFGTTGERVSEMCLGTMMFGGRCDEAEAERIVLAAMEGGVDFLDTAASYGQGVTEEIVGRIVKGRRDGLFIATKVTQSTAADWIKESIDQSLTRLQLEYVDLFMIHWPRPHMRIEEMMETLDQVVKSGKSRFVGCSNFPAWLLAHCNAVAERNGWAKLVCNQVPYNVVDRAIEVEILPQALAENIAITTYRPLMAGVLAGKYKVGEPIPVDSRGHTDQRIGAWIETFGDRLRRFEQFAADQGLHPAQLAVAWIRHSPAVTSPIVGCSSQRQVQATLAGFEVDLSAEQYAQVTAIFDDEEIANPEEWRNFPRIRRSFDLLAR